MAAIALRLILGAALMIAIPALLGGYAAERASLVQASRYAELDRGKAAAPAAAVVVVPRATHGAADLGEPLARHWRLDGAEHTAREPAGHARNRF